jgi:DMSO/TMAO reductase YedYZ heme-binding membrane subunit
MGRPGSRLPYADEEWPDEWPAEAPEEQERPPEEQERPKARPPSKRNRVDAWMAQEFTFLGRSIKRQVVALWILRLPAFFGLFFISHAVLTGNMNTLSVTEPDTLGTSSEINLMVTLLITPLITITGMHWFVSLRKWYGVMFGVTAVSDGVLATFAPPFDGGVLGHVAGHSFLLAGFLMVCILIPLTAISNNWAQKKMGRYWKQFQRLTYVVWGLLWVHLALLEGFGFQTGTDGSGNCPPCDGIPVLHQRLYQLTEMSLFLLVLRLPPVKRWITAQQKAGQQWLVYVAITPLFLLFMLGFVFVVNEEIFKGVDAFILHPSNE